MKTPEQWQVYIGQWIAAGCPQKNRENVMECLRRWSEADADGALAFVHGAERFPERNEAYALPLTAIGAKDMPRVIAWLQASLPERDRGDVAVYTIMALKDQHPQEALVLAHADQIPVATFCFVQIMEVMLKANPADALRVLDSLSENGKEDVAGAFAVAWARMDLNAAIEWCASQKGKPFAESAAMTMLEYFTREKPSEIVALVEKLGVTFDSNRYYGFMSSLTRDDPLAALGILQKMPPNQMRRYGDDVVQRLFQTDADQAVAAAQVIFPEGQRESRIYWGYQEWARSDRKAAEDWLAKEADSGVREQIKMQQAANEDPAAFLASISPATDLSGAFMSECLNDAMRRMAREQPSEALRWLPANPEQISEQRVRYLYYGNFSMSAADIMSVPEGEARETLVDFAAGSSLHRQNWGEAADLLPLVTDPAKQDKLRFEIFRSMMNKPSEQEAAREWLATQPLSDEVRASWEALAGR